jgi:hypothetical protein
VQIDMNPVDLLGELRAAHRNMTPEWRDRLIAAGADPGIVVAMLGTLPAQIEGRLWQPLEDAPHAIILPVFVDDTASPETIYPALAPQYGNIVDLIAFNITSPDCWALRTGAASWLGAYGPQLLDPDPVTVWRAPWQWVCNGGVGIVPLTDDVTELRRLFLPCGSLAVADAAYGRDLRRTLSTPHPIPRIFVQRMKEQAA